MNEKNSIVFCPYVLQFLSQNTILSPLNLNAMGVTFPKHPESGEHLHTKIARKRIFFMDVGLTAFFKTFSRSYSLEGTKCKFKVCYFLCCRNLIYPLVHIHIFLYHEQYKFNCWPKLIKPI